MIFNRRRRLPAVPPDPEYILVQRERRALQAQQQLQAYIDDQVLPRVNRLLGSEEFGSYHAEPLSINGSTSGVHIYEVSGTFNWVRPLLASLRGPAYRGYSVTAVAEWREVRSRSSSSRRKSIPLDENNPLSSLTQARNQRCGNGSVYVGVYVKMSR